MAVHNFLVLVLVSLLPIITYGADKGLRMIDGIDEWFDLARRADNIVDVDNIVHREDEEAMALSICARRTELLLLLLLLLLTIARG